MRVRSEVVEQMVVAPDEASLVSPLERPVLQALYAPGGFLEGGPLGAKCQRELLTEFHAVDESKQHFATISW